MGTQKSVTIRFFKYYVGIQLIALFLYRVIQSSIQIYHNYNKPQPQSVAYYIGNNQYISIVEGYQINNTTDISQCATFNNYSDAQNFSRQTPDWLDEHKYLIVIGYFGLLSINHILHIIKNKYAGKLYNEEDRKKLQKKILIIVPIFVLALPGCYFSSLIDFFLAILDNQYTFCVQTFTQTEMLIIMLSVLCAAVSFALGLLTIVFTICSCICNECSSDLQCKRYLKILSSLFINLYAFMAGAYFTVWDKLEKVENQIMLIANFAVYAQAGIYDIYINCLSDQNNPYNVS
ncbi:hypothetical protein ABPG74_005516 [Tetrahymena malaccensis]